MRSGNCNVFAGVGFLREVLGKRGMHGLSEG
jgi:hypothetical protein